MRIQRHKRIRGKIKGTSKVPRLCVFRSNKHIYAQLIDDDKGITIASSKGDDPKKVGKSVAEKAIEKKISKIVFDRAGFRYHGRIKDLADSAREAGLKF
ncbi:50S ribosomal protein L18 [Patescibacteria group bacterium]|nr:50S ribosomal protein L18 [Patescibacteria group bacterium]MBU3923071.1 50S ribosomal protein L18 [Patescibacteria group bacterium]